MAAETAEEWLRDGHAALAAADWARASDCFERASRLTDSAAALDGLSQALHFQGEYARSIACKERAFAEYRRLGKHAEAADLARWLAFLHACVHGNLAVASGWMGRAESLLEGQEESVAHGWVTLDRAPFTGDPAERERLATAAIVIARRFGDTDLEFDALSVLGESHVASGRVVEGMRLLDQAMTAVCGGEVASHGSVGMICCRLLSACEHTADVRRAEEWMATVQQMAAWSSFVSPTCRCHYGGILIAIGRWPEAEAELLVASATSRPAKPKRRGAAAMSADEQNKAAVRRCFASAADGNYDALHEIVSEDYVLHPDDVTGVAGLTEMVEGYRSAIGDLRVRVDQQFIEDDFVATRFTVLGTHTGELMGAPPTGRALAFSGIAISRCHDGRIVEEWELTDTLGLLRQVGALPAMAGA